MAVSALFWVSGFLVAALGISVGQIWLVYLGYGVLGGIGLGIGYISPVSTLIKWFPDRPGLATGMAIMGFGGGAMVASPLSGRLMSLYDAGYDPSDTSSVASGDAVAGLFVTLAAIYLVFMSLGAFLVRVPADDWRPEGWEPDTAAAKPMVTDASVSAANAIRTPQFWLLWTVLFCNVTAGIGILEQASPMIQDFFRDGDGSAVAAAAAAGAGAHLVNDVSGFVFDAGLAPFCAEAGLPVCIMHSQGTPQTMQDNPRYGDVLLEVYDFLARQIALAEAAGIPRHRIVADPGIGFGKTTAHNLALLRGLSLFHGLGVPLLLGASRKGLIRDVGQAPRAEDRMPGSVAVALAGVAQGVQILRIHDVGDTRQALRLWLAIEEGI